MTVTELRSIVSPVAALPADEVPPALLERAAAYNEAVAAFGDAIRSALGVLQRGGSLEADLMVSLRTCAAMDDPPASRRSTHSGSRHSMSWPCSTRGRSSA